MKKQYLVLILLAALLLSACKATISESAMETAVSQVILTSSSEESPGESEPQPESEIVATLNVQLEGLNAQLNNANIMGTEQAAKIEALQAELDGVYVLLTPTITPTPQDTPTPTITPSPTLIPSYTESALPWYHKYVEAVGTAPLYYYEDENQPGYPMMLKTSPIVKFSAGEEFIVNVNRIRADGGAYYYLIVGPKHEGYYVAIGDVEKLD